MVICDITDNKVKVEKKKASIAKLADITNLQQRPKMSIQDAKVQQLASFKNNEYIEKLQKENVTLMKVLADRNKVVELSGIELQKMRINLQKMQQQNLQLAQANSQMLAELNASKDRLKTLQHELGCKNGLLKARNLEEEVAKKKYDKRGECVESLPCNATGKQVSGCSTGKPVPSAVETVDKKSIPSRRQSARFKPQEPEATEDANKTSDTKCSVSPLHDETIQESCPASTDSSFHKELKEENSSPGVESGEIRPLPCMVEKADNKRVPRKRKSTRLKSLEPEPTEDVFEIDLAKIHVSPLHEEAVNPTVPASSGSSITKEEQAGNKVPETEVQDLKRTSVGRPLRRAAEKIQSYKEIPLNVKMRRIK